MATPKEIKAVRAAARRLERADREWRQALVAARQADHALSAIAAASTYGRYPVTRQGVLEIVRDQTRKEGN